MNKELDLCNVSFSQFYLIHRIPSASLVFRAKLGAALVDLFFCATRLYLFDCSDHVKALDSSDACVALAAFPVPDLGVGSSAATAIGMRLIATLGAVNL
jgi:hypothetical protein